MKNYKIIASLLSIICLLNFSCKNDDTIVNGDDQIDELIDLSELEVISDGESCIVEEFFLICETATVEDPIPLRESDLDYLIWDDKDVGDEVIFRNNEGDEFSIEITRKDRYLFENRSYAGCSLSIEHVSYICQQHEQIDIEFRTSFMENKLNRFELYRKISAVQNGVFEEPVSTFTVGQERGVDNIFEFYYRIRIDAEASSSLFYDFYETINIGGNEYLNVWDFGLYHENIHAEPKMHLYYNKKNGIIGFEKDGKIWFEVE